MKRGPDASGWIAATGAVAMLTCAAPARAAPLAFECDVPPSHYSELTQVATTPAPVVTGRIFVEELRKADDASPGAGIAINSADGKRQAVLRLVAPSLDKKVLRGQLYLNNGEKKQTIELGQIDGLAPIPIRLALSDTGKIDLQLGELRSSQPFVPLPAARITAWCATGEFNFRDLDFAGR
jgi:hypothetical protein